jgi:uncharacterized protein
MHDKIIPENGNLKIVDDLLVLVKPSGIHGMGVFANADIPDGANIMIISGEVIDEAECIRREEEDKNVYIFWNGDNYIDTVNTNVIKYINHNCDCNCEVTDRDENSLYLTAIRDIKSGEELTIDYGYDEIYDECSCNVCISDEESAETV